MQVVLKKLASTLDLIDVSDSVPEEVNLVIVYGNPFSIEDPLLLQNLIEAYPNAKVVGCSSAGESLNGESYENSIVFAAINFEKTSVKRARVDLPRKNKNEFQSGVDLANQLAGDNLAMILLLSEGLSIDCDELMDGVRSVLGPNAPVYGGLAGDDLTFTHTVVLDNQGPSSNSVVAVGLYGDSLRYETHASSFSDKDGVTIEVTKAKGNVIFEINDKPALEVYESIIASQCNQDAMASLHFPLMILDRDTGEDLYVRTMHEFDKDNKSILAAATVPEGPAKVMNLLDVKDFIEDAGQTANHLSKNKCQLALVISCAGRRGAMGEKWVKEQPEIFKKLGVNEMIGFYAYGEIGKSHNDKTTIIHNQTVNIATIYEV